MSVQQSLERLRCNAPGCYAVAYADMSTDMVLATAADEIFPQEFWDDVSRAAVTFLQTEEPRRIVTGQAKTPGVLADYAVLSDRDDTCVMVRSDLEPSFALCCMCTGPAKVTTLLKDAQATLSGLSDDG